MNKKYLAAAAIVSGMSFLPLANPASATSVSNDNKATIPVFLTVLDNAVTTYDVTIGDKNGGGSEGVNAEQIIMTQKSKDSNATEVTALTVQNNAKAAPVYIKEIKVTGKNGYTVQEYDVDKFKTYDVDSKQIALKLKTVGTGEEADLSKGWGGTKTVAAEDAIDMELLGLTANSSTKPTKTTAVADCVITLSLQR